jgi:glycosyltransferase involved in cell wall biosynthesis
LFTPRCSAGINVRIAHVGRWKLDRQGRDRGQREALDVFGQLPCALQWQGFLVGRGELEAELRRQAYTQRALPAERVQLMNSAVQPPRGFAELLATFHLGLVFAAGSDGTSRPATELLACGVPLLVADRPGLRELAEDPACATLLLPGDPQGWAHAIVELLKAPQRLAAMSAAARARAEKIHALPTRGLALAQFYRVL